MISTGSGSIKLFRFAGIQVLLHWSWLLVAWYQISVRRGIYDSVWWNVAEYLALFAIVLMHEFGHAFASRQVGGESHEILLWPFGGIAFVRVPPRPGAELWSIAAGPLVNVALIPVLWAIHIACHDAGWTTRIDGLNEFLRAIRRVNYLLLVFNLLPIYPLDGGQILRSLLWFVFGRARSLQIATVLGFVGIAAGIGLLLLGGIVRSDLSGLIWILLLAAFLGSQCLTGWKRAKELQVFARIPRHAGFTCPTCHEAPPGGPIWRCGNCGNGFDAFSTRGVCPHCAAVQTRTTCPNCGGAHPIAEWETRLG